MMLWSVVCAMAVGRVGAAYPDVEAFFESCAEGKYAEGGVNT